MVTIKPVDTREPKITREEILILQDENFNPDNVCVVTGAATGIGRATAVAADIKEFVKVRLAAHEYPREIEFVNELPMSATGKTMRKDLKYPSSFLFAILAALREVNA